MYQMITEFWPFGLMMAGTDPDDYVQSLEQLGSFAFDRQCAGTKEAVGSAGLIGVNTNFGYWSGICIAPVSLDYTKYQTNSGYHGALEPFAIDIRSCQQIIHDLHQLRTH